ncbi:hypothetical protein GUITHDRAFT_162110 [Guillardia theta CCMP2712]|uniref:Uncharacterized protein n=1 Tax=Guillardia theta (strain CCMP2712) TaxID=905079 RepID=L1JLK6_GUITC|nr:hypothetical protein GUITHDRAFT_162110 [Guillardia theta CCMP2712]EKX49237.1 hypothetical protein GUITHDRAFT_162110 [Guillardia theta CCMP2712]|mmetsp:Transcript_15619/g.52292  ORF Transcript_15619/g.52292 Transcript_15619/m.52292 type:complete len:168 (-) Transcript_15619:986-1489(-)|eukprot:XP_005836217.1 hypothetical protein GUITHDRAFT_162110 [Guillardia theta CCMP2712]
MAKGEFATNYDTTENLVRPTDIESFARRTRKLSSRATAVISAVALVMIICVKVSAAGHGLKLHDSEGFPISLGQNGTATENVTDMIDNIAHVEADEDSAKIDPDASFVVGWDKSHWKTSDWASWIIPGPIVTIFVTGFVFYMYGPAWAAGLCAVLVTVDVFAFYMNA